MKTTINKAIAKVKDFYADDTAIKIIGSIALVGVVLMMIHVGSTGDAVYNQ